MPYMYPPPLRMSEPYPAYPYYMSTLHIHKHNTHTHSLTHSRRERERERTASRVSRSFNCTVSFPNISIVFLLHERANPQCPSLMSTYRGLRYVCNAHWMFKHPMPSEGQVQQEAKQAEEAAAEADGIAREARKQTFLTSMHASHRFYTHVYVCVCMRVCACVYTRKSMHAARRFYTCVCVYVCVCVRARIYNPS
jgi:hypothetical protein